MSATSPAQPSAADTAHPAMGPCVQVALDVPLHQSFDFLAGDATAQDIGCLVRVPFGKRETVGVIVGLTQQSEQPPQSIKPVRAVLREAPRLGDRDLALARFLAGYYQHPLGGVLMAGIPPALRGPKAPEALARLVVRHVVLTEDGVAVATALSATAAADSPAPSPAPIRSAAQRRVLERLLQGAATRADLTAEIPAAAAALRALTQKGWVRQDVVQPGAFARPGARPGAPSAASGAAATNASATAGSTAPDLNPAQQHAVEQVRAALSSFKPFLLHGITGSGKSEVYLQLIGEVLARGQQALVLVPEIHLTPQLEKRFRERFPATPLVALHSHASAGDRLKGWLAAAQGRAGIVLGTRLAVMTPLPDLGLIVVDEEHDGSFKQQDGLRYSARDAAVVRASLVQCPVVLGSATPSLESWHNATAGESARYTLLSLPERAVPGARLPRVQRVDTNLVTDKTALSDGITPPLIEALKQRLARGEQSLVFINRRGFSPALVCAQCAWMPECTRCAARLVYHRQDRRLHCHHCGFVRSVPTHCGDCGSAELGPLGQGTQRVEEALARLLPVARIARLDRDVGRSAGRAQRIFADAAAGSVDILVGTQMLSKGHDFPRLTLVGVLNADDAMFSADFRAPERLFAQLVQVAGRAGRAGLPGEVILQTRFPSHPLYDAVAAQDFAAFARLQLQERQLAGLPPYSTLALLRVESRKPGEALTQAAAASAAGRALLKESAAKGISVHDALPATLARKAGWERAQVLVQAQSRPALQRMLAEWRQRLAGMFPRSVRWAVDVDPQEV